MANFADKDLGFNRLITNFKLKAGETAALAGFLRSAGTHQPKEEGKPSTPITVAALAAVMNYGSESRNIPARPFFTQVLKEREKEIESLLEKASLNVLLGKISEKQALGIVAQQVVDWIKLKIDSNIPPPNKPSTIAAKKSDRTLVDSHQLANSVDWEIMEGKK
jgi:hypothetical protein